MKRGFKTFLKEEDGMGVVEIILIIGTGEPCGDF